jgi:hypothetical protein
MGTSDSVMDYCPLFTNLICAGWHSSTYRDRHCRSSTGNRACTFYIHNISSAIKKVIEHKRHYPFKQTTTLNAFEQAVILKVLRPDGNQVWTQGWEARPNRIAFCRQEVRANERGRGCARHHKLRDGIKPIGLYSLNSILRFGELNRFERDFLSDKYNDDSPWTQKVI